MNLFQNNKSNIESGGIAYYCTWSVYKIVQSMWEESSSVHLRRSPWLTGLTTPKHESSIYDVIKSSIHDIIKSSIYDVIKSSIYDFIKPSIYDVTNTGQDTSQSFLADQKQFLNKKIDITVFILVVDWFQLMTFQSLCYHNASLPLRFCYNWLNVLSLPS